MVPCLSTVGRRDATDWVMQCPRRALLVVQVVDVLPASAQLLYRQQGAGRVSNVAVGHTDTNWTMPSVPLLPVRLTSDT